MDQVQTPPGLAHPALGMAAVCAVGGLIGMSKGSKASGASGLTFGALFGLASYLMTQNKDGGVELAMVSSAALAGAMVPRAVKTKKPVPLTLGTAGVLASLYYSRKWYEQTYGV